MAEAPVVAAGQFVAIATVGVLTEDGNSSEEDQECSQSCAAIIEKADDS